MKKPDSINPESLKAVCSVRELARLLNLSRQRFYQLIKKGVFPYPLYCPHTRRPFYSRGMQRQCLQIRRVGIGLNGQPILFYTPRHTSSPKTKSRKGIENKRLRDISQVLKQLGMNLSEDQLLSALRDLYPKGLPEPLDEGLIIRDLFRYFK